LASRKLPLTQLSVVTCGFYHYLLLIKHFVSLFYQVMSLTAAMDPAEATTSKIPLLKTADQYLENARG